MADVEHTSRELMVTTITLFPTPEGSELADVRGL